MPFTGSHPAAVLPFLGTRLVPSALVIGSMSPDLPYYVPVPLAGRWTHTTIGVVTVDVALGLAAFVVWHVLLARPALLLAPEGLRRRVSGTPAGLRTSLGTLGACGLVLASLAIGAATHVVWDAFTHDGRWGPAHIGWLADTHGPLAGYRWAQYASGLIGMALLAGRFALWWRDTPPVAPGAPAGLRRTRVVILALALAGVVGGLVAALPPLLQDGGADVRRAGFLAATRGGGAALALALALAVVFRFRSRNTPSVPPGATTPVCSRPTSRPGPDQSR